MKVKALITLHVDGDIAKPGQTVSLDKKEAESLIERNFVSYIDGGSKDEPSEPENQPSLEDIIEVIEMLDPETDYGKSGKPNVEAIETLLEANISADMRDQAWEEILKQQEEDE